MKMIAILMKREPTKCNYILNAYFLFKFDGKLKGKEMEKKL